MRVLSIIFPFVLAAVSGKAETSCSDGDTILSIVDFVDLPGTWTGGESGSFYMEFHESWHVPANLSGIDKRVESFRIHGSNPTGTGPGEIPDSLQLLLPVPEGARPDGRGKIPLGSISYEFLLLDPHSTESGNVAASGPGSMDLRSGEIQGVLEALVLRNLPSAKIYDLKSQLLSVIFYEEWFLDPVSGKIEKEVNGLSPVIWQRRRTTSGEPVNEADTGYPVYYKNQLTRIYLRNQ